MQYDYDAERNELFETLENQEDFERVQSNDSGIEYQYQQLRKLLANPTSDENYQRALKKSDEEAKKYLEQLQAKFDALEAKRNDTLVVVSDYTPPKGSLLSERLDGYTTLWDFSDLKGEALERALTMANYHLESTIGKDFPNIIFEYDYVNDKIITREKLPIETYCEERSIYYPQEKQDSDLLRSKLSFNVSDLESAYLEWIKKYDVYKDDTFGVEAGYGSTNSLEYLFYCYTQECGDGSDPTFSLTNLSADSFINYLKKYGFPLSQYDHRFKDFEFDPVTGNIIINTSNLDLDDYSSDITTYYYLNDVAQSAYRGKVNNDLDNGNEIQYRTSIKLLIEMLGDPNITNAEQLKQYLEANNINIIYQDGDYLYFSASAVEGEEPENYRELLSGLLYAENRSDSLYNFDFQELTNKSNRYLGINGMNLDAHYFNLGDFDQNSDEYKKLVERFNGNIGKIISSTYNGYTVFVPQTEGMNVFDSNTGLHKKLYELVANNEQSVADFGYSMSVRRDSFHDFDPRFDVSNYQNIVAETDPETGAITGYKIVLDNNQYIEIGKENLKDGKYVLYDPNDEKSVDSTVKRSVAYDCLKVTKVLESGSDEEKFDYSDVKLAQIKDEKGNIISETYYITVDGEQIALNKDEVKDKNGNIRSDLKQYVENKARESGKSINRDITTTNNRIVNKPKCISFDDETNYRGLVDYLKSGFKTLFTINVVKDGNDKRNVYDKINIEGAKKLLESAVEEARQSAVKVETSVRVLKTYDYDLKGIFDKMVDDIFKLGTVDKNENISFEGDKKYTDDKNDENDYKSDIIGLDFEGDIDKYIDSLQTYCKNKHDELDKFFKDTSKGICLTPEELAALQGEYPELQFFETKTDKDGNVEYGYVSIDGLASKLLRQYGDGFNMSEWLEEKAASYRTNNANSIDNPWESFANSYDLYNGVLNNTDNIANEIAMYDKLNKVTPLAKYAVTDEYEEVLDYIRNNYEKISKEVPDTFKYLTLEELSLYLMDSKYNTKSEYYDVINRKENENKSATIMDLLTEMVEDADDHTYGGMDPIWLMLEPNNDGNCALQSFLKGHGIADLTDRKAKAQAIERAKAMTSDGQLSASEQMSFQKDFGDGFFKYGKNTIDYIYCGLMGADSPWTEKDTEKAYLLELFAGDYTKKDVEKMYKDGLITEDDYNIRMQVLASDNSIKSDYQKYKNASGWLETLGGATADAIISTIPGFGKGLLSILKATSGAGQVARKLHDLGDNHAETFVTSTLTGLAAYFITKGIKSLEASSGGGLFRRNGTFGKVNDEQLEVVKNWATGGKYDPSRLGSIVNDCFGGSYDDALHWLNLSTFVNSKLGSGTFDAIKEILTHGNGFNDVGRSFITTTVYSAWQAAEGEKATAYNWDSFFSNDLFSVPTSDGVVSALKKSEKNITKAVEEPILKWLWGLVDFE